MEEGKDVIYSRRITTEERRVGGKEGESKRREREAI